MPQSWIVSTLNEWIGKPSGFDVDGKGTYR